MPREQAERLLARAQTAGGETTQTDTDCRKADSGPFLVVDAGHPEYAVLNGKRVALQEKQFRLLATLAARPGECVPYEQIYEAVWGDVVVETNQLYFQKRRLLERLQSVLPEGHRPLVRTIPKRGFLLDLPREQVRRVMETGTA